MAIGGHHHHGRSSSLSYPQSQPSTSFSTFRPHKRIAVQARRSNVVCRASRGGTAGREFEEALASLCPPRRTHNTSRAEGFSGALTGVNEKIQIEGGALLSEHCTWRLGGPATVMAVAKTDREADTILAAAAGGYGRRPEEEVGGEDKSLQVFVLGKGSNVLFSDKGFNGVVLKNAIDFVGEPVRSEGTSTTTGEEWHARVGGGAMINLLAQRFSTSGFSGLEFASGIPGTVGGSVYMNAGACGRCVGDAVISVEYVDGSGNITTVDEGELVWSYRQSLFMEMERPLVITAATFRLTRDKPGGRTPKDIVTEYINKRRQTQPVESWTSGCVFRNPEGDTAGRLIDAAGLKGARVGGVAVSDKHANFLINHGAGSSEDMRRLITKIKHTIRQQTGNELEEEIRIVPYDGMG